MEARPPEGVHPLTTVATTSNKQPVQYRSHPSSAASSSVPVSGIFARPCARGMCAMSSNGSGAGRHVYERQRLPDYFLIGPPRTGTSWLHSVLNEHTVLPTTKETRF